MNTFVIRRLPVRGFGSKRWVRWGFAFSVLLIAHFLFLAAGESEPQVAPTSNNLAVGLVDDLKYETLEEISFAKLQQARLPNHPWSDSYWPIFKGSLANRYSDPAFPDSIDWKENADFIQANLGQGALESLSPAEKYDLLVGDPAFTLTQKMLDEGRPYYEKNQQVEPWMGLCHGWAPASFMEKRPVNAVETLSFDGGKRILFYPSDIKALATLLWAKGRSRGTRFIGRRCNTASPPRDRLGRPLQQECLDTNAGTWHLSIVNQIGVSGRAFVMDATPDYEVWNHPVLGYSYSYFSPVTGKTSATITGAKISRSSFPSDPRAAFRVKGSTDIIGIRMKVDYLVETFPSDRRVDSDRYDGIKSVTYEYELELDPDGKILGGEWISQDRPDFLWTESAKSVPQTAGDQLLDQQLDRSSWKAADLEKVPYAWQSAARRSANAGQPLRRIVRGLIQAAQATH